MFKLNFTTMVNWGTNGNGVEKSLESLMNFTNNNASWANANNLLVIIFMSDELEQSYSTNNCALPSGRTSAFTFTPACIKERVQWSINQITKLKARKELIKVHSIVNFGEDYGKVYEAISKEFSGTYQSISSPFSSILAQIGTSIADSFLEYNLVFQGKFKSVKSVKIDGIILPNLYNENYEFIAPNKIKLKNKPGEGKVIEVEFEYTNETY
jgi:hypothetical protein